MDTTKMYRSFPLPQTLVVQEMITAFHTAYPPGFSFEGEYHDFWELVCVLDGSAGIAADNQIYQLKPGQIAFHRPLEFHRIWTEGTCDVRLATMAFIARGMEPFEQKVLTLSLDSVAELENLIRQIPLAFQTKHRILTGLSGDSIEEELFRCELELFLLHALRDSTRSNRTIYSRSAQNYMAVVKLLNENINKNLTLTEIASQCSMSSANLKKIFHKYAGIGVIKYYTILKMKRAIQLLTDGQTVGEVSRALGYADQNYFSAAFKRELGCAPSVYHKRNPFVRSHTPNDTL